MTATNYIERVSRELPTWDLGHWLLRIPLAWIILYQGISKVPLTQSDAESFSVPFIMWGLACLGEIVAGLMLIGGGFMRNHWMGDLVTRLAGLMIGVIVTSVIVWVYWAPIWDLVLYQQFHVLLMMGGFYFAARGNLS